MEVLLLGTGGPRGWPEPGCTCASCSVAVRSRTSRAPSSALVDGALLVDGYDGLERTAAHAGRDLRRVRQVLLAGPPEHPASWLDALGGTAPVQVLGPATALDGLGAMDARFQLLPVSPGEERRTPDGYRVRALPQGAGLAWSVVAPAGTRLLHAPGPGEVDGASVPAPFDLVLMGLPGSRGVPSLSRLRRDVAVGPSTEVRAVGYGHADEPPDVLQHLLAAWEVGATRDGDVLRPGGSTPAPLPPGRTLVLGGVRSGKSALAEQLLAAQPHVTYIATGGTRADDVEWQQRVDAHRARRPAFWTTIETTDLTDHLLRADRAVLIDCLGTWLTALLDRHAVWEGGSPAPVEAAVEELLRAWRASRVPLVAVSNEVGSGVVPATPSGRLFRDLLGRLNARVAAESETVLLTVAGVPVPLRVAAGP